MAVGILETTPTVDAVSFNTVISACARAGNVAAALQVFKRMLQKEAEQKGRAAAARPALEPLSPGAESGVAAGAPSLDCTPSVVTFNTLISMLSSDGALESAAAGAEKGAGRNRAASITTRSGRVTRGGGLTQVQVKMALLAVAAAAAASLAGSALRCSPAPPPHRLP